MHVVCSKVPLGQQVRRKLMHSTHPSLFLCSLSSGCLPLHEEFWGGGRHVDVEYAATSCTTNMFCVSASKGTFLIEIGLFPGTLWLCMCVGLQPLCCFLANLGPFGAMQGLEEDGSVKKSRESRCQDCSSLQAWPAQSSQPFRTTIPTLLPVVHACISC